MADKGYVLLWRKFFDHPLWQETRIYSKAEAWIDIVCCLTRGVGDSRTGLNRGEFRASLTWLASRWNWDKAKVQRFIGQLTTGDDPMLRRMASGGQDVRVFKVCNFDKYQSPKTAKSTDTPTDTHRDTPPDTPGDTPKPAKLLVFTGGGDTPPDTPGDTAADTPSDTNKKRKINTGEKKELPSDGRHAGFVRFLFERHPKIVIGKPEHRSLRDVLSLTKNNLDYSVEKLQAYWEIFQADEFDRQQGASLGYFCRKINKFVNAYTRTHGTDNGGNGNGNSGTPTEARTGRGDLQYTPKQ